MCYDLHRENITISFVQDMYLLMQFKIPLALLGAAPSHHRYSFSLLPNEISIFIYVLLSQVVPGLYLYSCLLEDPIITTFFLLNFNVLDLIQCCCLSKLFKFWFHHQ